MATIYLKVTPIPVSHTGWIHPAQYFDFFGHNITWNGVIQDERGLQEIGYLTGSGADIGHAIQIAEKKMDVIQLNFNEFVGYCALSFDSSKLNVQEGETPPTFIQFMEQRGVTVGEEEPIEEMKEAQLHYFKELTKKKFTPYNDTDADIAKGSMLFSLYEDSDLTPEQIATRNDLITRAKTVYTPDICLSGFSALVGQLETIMVGYYMTKLQLDGATTKTEIKNVDYDG